MTCKPPSHRLLAIATVCCYCLLPISYCPILVIDTTATPESENSAADQSQITDVSGAGPSQREVYRFQPYLPRRLFLGSIATPNLVRWKVDGLNWWQVILAFLAHHRCRALGLLQRVPGGGGDELG